jgi:hypothetical protein
MTPLDPRLITLYELPRIVELRLLGKRRRPLSIFLRDSDTFAEALAHPDVKGLDAYAIFNRLCDDVAARHGIAEDTLFAPLPGQCTQDADIVRITRLPYDLDPTRPTGTAATLEQVRLSAKAMDHVIRYLCDRVFPEQAVIASGNGTHAYNATDLPNTPETAALLTDLYVGLAKEFGTELVKFDVTVRSAAQLMRVPLSFNYKAGRFSEILTMPEILAPVSLETIQAVVEELRTKYSKGRGMPAHGTGIVVGREGGWTSERMEALLDFHGIDYGLRKLTPQGMTMWILRPCPFNEDHALTSPAVFVTPKGWPRFKCRHDSCATNHWKQFLQHLNLTNRKVFSWTSPQFANKSLLS